jgi:pimeloyl-ACP methyl ester carboxylesterase
MRSPLQAFVLLPVLCFVGCSQADDHRGTAARAGESQPSTVRSADGTFIGYARIGDGPYPLVIVHGVLDTADSWVPVAEALSEQCSCYVMDRRGRGRSGDGDSYSFENEIEDIEAVLREAGPNAFLLGHSSGAIYTLEAARRTPLAGLILYEPPLHYEGFDAVVDEIRSLVSQGRLDDAAAVFLAGEGGLSESEIAALQQAPFWPTVAQLAPSLVREWDAIFGVEPTVERYQDLSMPTLLLAGSENLNNPTFATADFADRLADVRMAILEGQGHTANESVPELVADRVAEFLHEAGE